MAAYLVQLRLQVRARVEGGEVRGVGAGAVARVQLQARVELPEVNHTLLVRLRLGVRVRIHTEQQLAVGLMNQRVALNSRQNRLRGQTVVLLQ